MYSIEWKEKALDDLEKLENIISERIVKKVEELASNPFSKDLKRLKGSFDFRFRVGDYRVILSIKGNVIIVLKVGHRKNIYER